MSKTIDNLQTAFAGDPKPIASTWLLPKKRNDGWLPQIARLFRAAALAETVHAHNHLRAMDGVKATAENLQAAIGGENYEVVSMYPPMLAEAELKATSAPPGPSSMRWKWRVHEALYRKAAEVFGKARTCRKGITMSARCVVSPTKER